MVQINFARKEINCKIVYYGPGMSGKTTNLEIVHQKTPGENKGELTCIATEGDRTLFFDFMPLNLGNIMGMNVKFQLYTVPGQVYYNSTRKLVLRGVDGVIFIADSAPDKMAENIESLDNLRENLDEYGKDINEIPIVIQYNKQDLPNALSSEEMDKKLNSYGAPAFPGVASKGEGVFTTLKALSAIIIENINQKDDSGARSGRATPTAKESTPANAASAPHPETVDSHSGTAPGFVAASSSGGTDHHSHDGSGPGHQQAAALHGGHESTGTSGAAVQVNPDGHATATLESQAATSHPSHLPHTQQSPQTEGQASTTAAKSGAQTKRASGKRPAPAKKAHARARQHRQGGQPVRSRASNRSKNTAPKQAGKNRAAARSRPQNQPAEATTKSGNKWGLVLAAVFVVVFGATALVALFL